MKETPPVQLVVVRRGELERLVTEVMMLREFLPKVLSQEYLGAFTRLTQLEQGQSSLTTWGLSLVPRILPACTVCNKGLGNEATKESQYTCDNHDV